MQASRGQESLCTGKTALKARLPSADHGQKLVGGACLTSTQCCPSRSHRNAEGALLQRYCTQRTCQGHRGDRLHWPQEGQAPAISFNLLGICGLVHGLRHGDKWHASDEAFLKAVEACVRDEGVRVCLQHLNLLHRGAQCNIGRHLRQSHLLAGTLEEVQRILLPSHAHDAVVAVAEFTHGLEERPPHVLAEGLPVDAGLHVAA
mmetsp:Transcript_71990/g.163408  ORF Transcript_71990/g.163408 Transcript_71990/m.163408 type:complete len:204 (-) Transcript_71990:220-831(-)